MPNTLKLMMRLLCLGAFAISTSILGFVKVVDVFSPENKSVPSHSPPYINAILKTLWHTVDALIYKVLAHFLLSFICYFAGFELIPMRELLEMLLHHLPIVLDGGKVW